MTVTQTYRMTSLHQILVVRDGLTVEQARERIQEAQSRIAQKTASYEQILRDEMGVDPDYYWMQIAPQSAMRILND